MFRVFNAQFSHGRECESLQEAREYLRGWQMAWIEDASGRVVEGIRSEKWVA